MSTTVHKFRLKVVPSCEDSGQGWRGCTGSAVERPAWGSPAHPHSVNANGLEQALLITWRVFSVICPRHTLRQRSVGGHRPVLEVENLSKAFGARLAVDGVSFAVGVARCSGC